MVVMTWTQTYNLHNAFTLTCSCNRAFSIRVDKLGHRCRTHKQWKIAVDSENLCPRINRPNVSQHPWSKPYPVEAGLVRIPGDQIRSRAGIKGPRLLTGRLRRDNFEIVRIDQRLQRRFLAFNDDLGILLGLRPFVVDCRLIQDPFVLFRR